MSLYANLKSRIDTREIIVLDGAIGTQLQSMGVPMNQTAWASAALETHPFTVRRMHEKLHRRRGGCHHHQHLSVGPA